MELQNELKRVKAALSVLRAAPDQQALADRIPPLAENLLFGVISEEEFQKSLQEIDWQRTRTTALGLARNSIAAQELALEEEMSKQELSAQREQGLAAAKIVDANRWKK